MKSNLPLLRTLKVGVRTITISALVAGCLAISQVGGDGQVLLATGLDASDTLIGTGGVADAHWQVSEQAGGTGAAVTVYPNNADWFSGWLANGGNSDWVARDANTSNNGPAPYTFFTQFDLTGFDPTSAEMFGSWAIDDAGTLRLNGNILSNVGGGNWGSLTNFSVFPNSPFFLPGLNTLSITITSADQSFEAVRLQGALFANAAVPNGTPEPGSLALFAGVAAAGVGIVLRRRA